jgi:uncharacterized iron-regulated protein
MARDLPYRWRRRGAALAAATLACAGPLHAQASAAADKPCFAPSSWVALDAAAPRPVAAGELLAELARRDVVLLGEQHDAADDHHWQLQTLAALQLLRPRMVIGFESFPRRVQPVLDRWVAGELTERQFLEQAEWAKVWNFPAELYLPMFRFARINRIPMLALNVNRELTQAIAQRGWDGVAETQKEGVSRPAAPTQAYQDQLFEVYKEHRRSQAGGGAAADRNGPEFLRFVESQATWDRAMAEALARQVRAAPRGARPLVVGIMGSGHVRNGHGVPHQLRDLGVTSIGTLLPLGADDDCSEARTGLADAVFALPGTPHEAPPRPRLGVSLQPAQDGVTVVEVTAGSLAEATGLRKGDRIVMLAGARVTKLEAVIAAVRAQPDGTWLPMQVQRDGKALDLVVKFPPAR